MTGAPGLPSLLGLAVDGMRRKIGRNLLTAGGVFVGVLALTLIVSLGQGMTQLIRDIVSSEDNLRQIGLSGGLGTKLSDEDVKIEGEMDDALRARLERAARARSRPGGYIGRRAQTIDVETLRALESIPHVVRTIPIVVERYQVKMGEHELDIATTIGVDAERRRYEERVVAGGYFRALDADEVLLHEYLAYRWGFVTTEELTSLVGREIVLTPLGKGEGAHFGAGPLGEILSRIDLSTLTEEERRMLPGIAAKLAHSLTGPSPTASEPGGPMTLKIAGVLRDFEATDPFNVIEDGNAVRVDVFLPQATAIRCFFASPVNREIGFSRAYVLVDDSKNAKAVEDELREQGYTAFSVASVMSRVESMLFALTIIVGLLTGIALFVAALGIVNTMITSVIERRREIGLWKAVGATSGQVRTVFLLEAAGIGLVGGVLGLGAALLVQIPAGDAAARAIAEQALFPIRGSVFHVPLWLPIAGPLLATLIAMAAALYPAHRAARIDPVRALRDE